MNAQSHPHRRHRFQGVTQSLAIAAMALMLLGAPHRATAADANADGFSWVSVADAIAAALDDAADSYAEGDARQAKRHLTTAYFGVFEGRKMEAAMRKMLGRTHTYEVEERFGDIRKMIGSGAPEDIRAQVDALSEQVRADARELDRLGVPKEVYDVD
jgi:hypothetical protein